MPVETADDRAAFLDADEFGVEAIYTPNGGAGVSVNGIFDGPTTFEDIGERAMAQTSRVTFCCQQADLPPAAAGDARDKLELNHPVSGVALTFRVLTIEPDGTGMALLSLGKAA